MARIKVEEVVDHLDTEFRGALIDALGQVSPNTQVDAYEFFRAFKRAVYRKCSIWENVPDQYVEK